MIMGSTLWIEFNRMCCEHYIVAYGEWKCEAGEMR
jgi:hypothetical protein